MSTYGDWASSFRTTMLQNFGKNITYRRQTTIGTTPPAVNPILGAVTVHALTLAGLSTITFTAPAVGTWALIAGDTFTITGDATTYTVAAQVLSANGLLSGVTFTPVLAHNAALNAAVTFTWLNDYVAPARIRSYRDDLINGISVKFGDIRVIMTTTDVNGRAISLPRPGDPLFVDGATRTVVQASPLYAADTQIHYEVQVRG